jgi:general secretion pathway protein G
MSKNKGFTLVELVVVVMILGILAAVAAPKLLNTSGSATDNGVKQTLAVVRDAIERYTAEHNGSLPAQGSTTAADFTGAIEPYLRGPFPKCPVTTAKDDTVKMTNAAGALAASGAESWHYNSKTGEFIINSAAATKSDPNVTYDAL